MIEPSTFVMPTPPAAPLKAGGISGMPTSSRVWTSPETQWGEPKTLAASMDFGTACASWLGNLDSNQDKQSQSLLCYRYTIPQSITQRNQ